MALVRAFLFESPWIYRILRFLLAATFIVAGSAKLMDPRGFARIISAYDILPEEFLVYVAITLPAIELLAGAGLLLNIRGSLATICGLLAAFLVLLGYAVLRGLDVDCGCFSPSEIHAKNELHMAFLRDLGLMTVSIYLAVWRRFHARLQPANI